MPARVIAPMTTIVSVPMRFARRQADSCPSVAILREKTVTKAVESAPSANRSRSRFGIRNAAMKYCISRVPKSALKMISRASPSTREHITAAATMAVFRPVRGRVDSAIAGSFPETIEDGGAQSVVGN
jgi:hypothetical protein